MVYHFEELRVWIDGMPAHFTGTAYLGPNRGSFWVAAVSIDPNCLLDRSGSPLARHLDAAISEAIEESPHARDAWAAHCEEERADAA